MPTRSSKGPLDNGSRPIETAAADPTNGNPPSQAGPGLRRQSEIYRAGATGSRPKVPTDFGALEAAARHASSPKAWAYVAGGAGEGRTMIKNRRAFERWSIVPRMGQAAATRDLSVELLGRRLPFPVLLAPIGAAALMGQDSDLKVSRAASAVGAPYVVSNQGCEPMEQCASEMGSTPWWFQLYWSKDESLVDSLIHRAEVAGAHALVVTLDTTMLGWRPQDLNLGSLPFSQGLGIAQYTSDRRFLALVHERVHSSANGGAAEPVGVTLGAIRTLLSMTRNYPGRFLPNLRSPEPRTAVETFLNVYSNPGLSWDHLSTLRHRTRLPIVLKGILHPDDARRAFDIGADAVVVSNHGGRQVDNAIASLDALVDVRDALGPERTILFDSGVRTGADVFTALAIGADAVLLGRPYMYGLAVAGRVGVEDVVRNILAELDLTMALAGVTDIGSIRRELLRCEPSEAG
jgi:lactate 2-monooxygenase